MPCFVPSALFSPSGGRLGVMDILILLCSVDQLMDTCPLTCSGSSRDQEQQDLAYLATLFLHVSDSDLSQPASLEPVSHGRSLRTAILASQIPPSCHGSLLPILLAGSLTSTIWSLPNTPSIKGITWSFIFAFCLLDSLIP